MKNFHSFTVALLTLMLVACGGGGDDSSSGAGSSSGSTSSSTTVNLAQFAGTYTGTITATVTVNGGSQTLTRPITIVISGDGQTITIEGVDFPLASDNFNVTVAIPLAEEGVVCTLDATIMGNITADLISGTITGSGNCVIEGVNVPAELTGYSGASKI
jgi:hypothetical protein